MRTAWQSENLSATIDCASGKKQLKGGGRGWFEVSGDIEWMFDWHLRVECSVTEPKPDYRLSPSPSTLFEGRYFPNETITFIVENDIVEIIFSIPDCIKPFQKSGWGSCAGAAILLSDQTHHWQVRLFARPPDYRAVLKKTTEGIEFLRSGSVLGRLPNHSLAHDGVEDFKAALREHERMERAAEWADTPEGRTALRQRM